jgi:2-C-methyl-D-erythritol 4-phosphate cytidylyltransferase
MAGVWAIVVAAGSGRRFGGAKQYRPLGGRRVLDWSVDAARTTADGVVLVVAPAELDRPEPAADAVVAGADSRSGSVRAGLAAVPDDAEVVVVHDAARPLAGAEVFAAAVAAVRAGADAAVPVVPVRRKKRRFTSSSRSPSRAGASSWSCRTSPRATATWKYSRA